MRLAFVLSCSVLLSFPIFSDSRGFFRGDSEKKGPKYLTPPQIKTQIRILRNFQHGSEATITLIFQASRGTYIRWFKKEPSLVLDGSEVPGYFPIDGDSRFWVELLSSNDVTSATLHIRRYKAEFPDSYETIITTDDYRAQYNIRTNIFGSIVYEHHYIYSPEWLIYPQDKVFQTGGDLEIGCQAIVPLELAPSDDPTKQRYPPYENKFNSDNELFFNRFRGQLQPTEPEDMIIKVGKDAYPEDYSNRTEHVQGINHPEIASIFREPNKFDHVIYDARLETTNATTDRQGIYQCNLLRRDVRGEEFEKSYINAIVTLKGQKSPYLSISNNLSVKAVLKPCNLDDDDELNKLRMNNVAQSILMVTRKKNCVRCIAMGYPKPKIELLERVSRQPSAFAVVSHTDILEVKSVNVASGGTVETTFIFLNPNPELNNRYKCRASNWKGNSNAEFDLKVS